MTTIPSQRDSSESIHPPAKACGKLLLSATVNLHGRFERLNGRTGTGGQAFQTLDGLWLLLLFGQEVMLESLVDPSCPPVPILPLSYEHLLRAVNAEARQTYVQAMAGGSTNSRLPMIPLSVKYLVR